MADIKPLSRYSYKYVVVDEGHRLKNSNCRLLRELRTLDVGNKLLLTGALRGRGGAAMVARHAAASVSRRSPGVPSGRTCAGCPCHPVPDPNASHPGAHLNLRQAPRSRTI